MHVPLIKIIVIVFKLWQHVVDHNFSSEDLLGLHSEHLVSKEDVVGLHLHWPWAIGNDHAFSWTIVCALSEPSFGEGSGKNGLLAVNVAVLILFELVPVPLGDTPPVRIHH